MRNVIKVNDRFTAKTLLMFDYKKKKLEIYAQALSRA